MSDEQAAGHNLVSGAAFAAGIGAVAGAALAARGGVRAVSAGALAGAAALAAVDYTARRRQKPNEIPALWSRIAASTALAAPAGWLADRLGAGPIAVGVGTGTVAGAHRSSAAEGRARPCPRSGRGRRFRAASPDAPGALVAATTVLAYRSLSAAVFRDAQVTLSPIARLLPTCRSWCRSPPAAGTSAPATSRELADRIGGTYHRAVRRRRHRRRVSTSCAGPDFDPAAVDAARPRVLRAHHPLHARHRAAVAAVGTPRLPALPHAGRPPARSGERADEPARGAARRPQPHRHDHAARQRGRQRPRLDPLVRRHRRAHLRRHLHHLPPRRPRLRQRRLPGPAGQLHRNPRAAPTAPMAAWS